MDQQLTLKERFPFLNIAVLQARLNWSIRLRWLAILGYFLATVFSYFFIELEIHYRQVWFLLAGLALINLLYYLTLQLWKDFTFRAEVKLIHLHILVDLIFLSAILHYSGGIENPAFLFFIFHVVLSSILFSRVMAVLYSLLIVMLFSTVVLLEAYEFIEHYVIFDPHFYHNQVFVFLTIVTFMITVASTNYICTGFMKIYRKSKLIIDRQNQQLVEVNKQKTTFFQFASHELKSPVVAIKSTLDVLLKGYAGTIDSKTNELLGRASNRAEQMLNIINELLDLTHSRSANGSGIIGKVNLHEVIKNVVQQEEPEAALKKITIKINLAESEITFEADKEDLEKIFSNLIGNAVRYGKKDGHILISSKLENERIIVDIEDDGIGIPGDDLENIFKEFYRSENAKKNVNFGTGLGLTLVKQLIERYNGVIQVESELGTKTIFRLSLPLSGRTS